jgi:hypothetical protein
MNKIPTQFEIDADAVPLFQKWVDGLPDHGEENKIQRITFAFKDNGIVTEISAHDAMTGRTFSWAPPLENW